MEEILKIISLKKNNENLQKNYIQKLIESDSINSIVNDIKEQIRKNNNHCEKIVKIILKPKINLTKSIQFLKELNTENNKTMKILNDFIHAPHKMCIPKKRDLHLSHFLKMQNGIIFIFNNINQKYIEKISKIFEEEIKSY